MGRFIAFSRPTAVARRAGDSPGVDDDGRFSGSRSADFASTPTTLPLRSCRIGPTTVTFSCESPRIPGLSPQRGVGSARGQARPRWAGEAVSGQGSSSCVAASTARRPVLQAQPLVSTPAADKLGHGAEEREAVPADFVPRKRGFFEKQDPEAGHGEIVGGPWASRPAPTTTLGAYRPCPLVSVPLCTIQRHNLCCEPMHRERKIHVVFRY